MSQLSPRQRGRFRAPSPARPAINDEESPLAWLHRRRDKAGAPLISDQQFKAGERLRRDYTLARMMPRVTIDWSSGGGARGRRSAPGVGVEMQDHVVAARERVRRALSVVGPELSGILVDVCCHLKGLEQAERGACWPQRTGRIVLLIALSALARHYGYDRSDSGAGGSGGDGAPPGRIRHWGADDYRPPIGADGAGAAQDGDAP